MFFISVGIGLYYNVIIAWTLYYFGATLASLFDDALPWVTCHNDWNSDGDFGDPGEQVATNIADGDDGSTDNIVMLPLTVPANSITGISYARFRYSTTPNLTPAGFAHFHATQKCERLILQRFNFTLPRS